MLLFKDYESFKKENAYTLDLLLQNDTINYIISPIINVLDYFIEAYNNRLEEDKDLDEMTFVEYFTYGFDYLTFYLQTYKMLNDSYNLFRPLLSDADNLDSYISFSYAYQYLTNCFKKIKNLNQLESFIENYEKELLEAKTKYYEEYTSKFNDILINIIKINKLDLDISLLYPAEQFRVTAISLGFLEDE